MRNLLIAAVAALLPLSALAAPQDWTAYLCKWGEDGETLLVKVDTKEARVLIYDRDASGVSIKGDVVAFNAPRGQFWALNTKTHAASLATVYPTAQMYNASCRVVDDAR